ncbi:MAG: shufflon system plasmid conjugative transfer pilus tip adhesin PilV [Flavobacteriales bacterium]|nr:shufflon system plasmid conjugative transfer pilus tip adhesin PilV [Flavobacteriales bacterium]
MPTGSGTTDYLARWTSATTLGSGATRDNGTRVGIGTAPHGTYQLQVGGDVLLTSGWLRTTGSTGWYNETHAGGWYMTDATWIRTYNNKSIYQNAGIMRTDGTLQVGSSGGTLNVVSGGDFSYRTNVLFANTAGNVGIGNTSPGYKLEVTGTGKYTGTLTTATPTLNAAVTDLGYDAPIEIPQINTGSGGFVPMIQATTLITSGYRKHVNIGTYRTGSAWNGGIYLAQGGNDSYPTEYFLFGMGGAIDHSSGNISTSGTIRIGGGSPAAGRVLQSDASGNASWVDASTLSVTGDNLGNHTATMALAMAGNAINNAQQINSNGDHFELMTNRTDDNAYEWVGFYSGATRQGIILYDGAWSGANNVTNEFSITAESSNLLTLNTTGNSHIALMPKGTGKVGIGTLAPATKLHVDGGDIRLNDVSNVAGYTLKSYSTGSSLWLLSGNTSSSQIVVSTSAHDWDRQVALTYAPGSTGAAAGDLQIGQISKNNANWTHGITRFYTNGAERMRIDNAGNVGIGVTGPLEKLHVSNNIRADGIVYWGDSQTRTETRNDAGLQGNAGARSGFYQTSAPSNFPTGATNWWHLLDVRHSNAANNYAMQFSSSFFNQRFFARNTNGSATQAWSEILTIPTDNGTGTNSAWTLAQHGQYSDDDLGGFGWTGVVDDSYFSATMPFSITINGTAHSALTLNTNGTIVFGSTTAYVGLSYGSLPNSATSLPMLAWYWRDLVARYRYGTVGTAPNRVYIIDFDSNAYNTGDDVDGQIQIHETSGLINVFYRVMDAAVNGQNGTIGFQMDGGSSAKAYPITYNGKVFDDNRLPQSWSVCPVR